MISSNKCMYLLPKVIFDKISAEGDAVTKSTLSSGQVRQLNNLDVHDGGRVIIRNDDHYKHADVGATPSASAPDHHRPNRETPTVEKQADQPDPNLQNHFRRDHASNSNLRKNKPSSGGEENNQNAQDESGDSDGGDDLQPKKKKTKKRGRRDLALLQQAGEGGDDDDPPDEEGGDRPPASPESTSQQNLTHASSGTVIDAPQRGEGDINYQTIPDTGGDERRLIIPADGTLNWTFDDESLPLQTSSPNETAPPLSMDESEIGAPIPALIPAPIPAPPDPPAQNLRPGARMWYGPAVTKASLEKERMRQGLAGLPKRVQDVINSDILGEGEDQLSPEHRTLYDRFMANLQARTGQNSTPETIQPNTAPTSTISGADAKKARDKNTRAKAKQQRERLEAIIQDIHRPTPSTSRATPQVQPVAPIPREQPPAPLVPPDPPQEVPDFRPEVARAESERLGRDRERYFRDFVRMLRRSTSARVDVENMSRRDLERMMTPENVNRLRYDTTPEVMARPGARYERQARNRQPALPEPQPDILSNALPPPNTQPNERQALQFPLQLVARSRPRTPRPITWLGPSVTPSQAQQLRGGRQPRLVLSDVMAPLINRRPAQPPHQPPLRLATTSRRRATRLEPRQLTWLGPTTQPNPILQRSTRVSHPVPGGSRRVVNPNQPPTEWLRPDLRSSRKRASEEDKGGTKLASAKDPPRKKLKAVKPPKSRR